MIKVSHLNKGEFYVNCELIEQMEETPDTVLTMLSGRKILVSQSTEEIISLTLEFKQKAHGIKVIK
ncbi:MAG: flagellar FlbD family protein [Clostridiales bacterium]|nr:flagellar FlbD family protein [Clostridiales bacterium]